MEKVYLQGRYWTVKQLEQALNTRSKLDRKITHLAESNKRLQDYNRRLQSENINLHEKLNNVIKVAKGEAEVYE